jgi:hypothetical protein
MTQRRTRFSYALGIVGLVLAVESLAPAVALASARIVSIQGGTVQVRRSNGRYVQGRVNTRLNSGDALLPARGVRVRVQCPNGRRRRATAGRLSGMRVICPDLARSTGARNENDLPQLLAGQFPYVPHVWGDTPTFIWPDVSPTAPYRVQVIQVTFVQPESSDPFEIPAPERVETVLHEATVTENRWTYDGPPLGVEGRYQVRVETPMATVYQVPFQLVPSEAATELIAGVEALQDLEADVETEALALAYLYRDAELYWAVIDLLQPLVAQGEVSATIHQLLAESYLKTGNTGAAATHFSAAVTLAQAAVDVRTEAEAWVGLAKVAAASQDREAVVERLQRAQVIYQTLAVDEGWVAALEEWLTAIDRDAATGDLPE